MVLTQICISISNIYVHLQKYSIYYTVGLQVQLYCKYLCMLYTYYEVLQLDYYYTDTLTNTSS